MRNEGGLDPLHQAESATRTAVHAGGELGQQNASEGRVHAGDGVGDDLGIGGLQARFEEVRVVGAQGLVEHGAERGGGDGGLAAGALDRDGVLGLGVGGGSFLGGEGGCNIDGGVAAGEVAKCGGGIVVVVLGVFVLCGSGLGCGLGCGSRGWLLGRGLGLVVAVHVFIVGVGVVAGGVAGNLDGLGSVGLGARLECWAGRDGRPCFVDLGLGYGFGAGLDHRLNQGESFPLGRHVGSGCVCVWLGVVRLSRGRKETGWKVEDVAWGRISSFFLID